MFDTVAVLVLVACLVVGTVSSVNIGVLALAGALVVGTALAGESVPEVLAGFPVNLFLLILGVTYLFGLAAANGTMEYLLHRLAGRLGGRRHLMPVSLFVVTLAAVSVGAALPAVSAIIGGLAVRLSSTLRVPVLLTALMVLIGGIGGTFSPITLGGIIVHSTLARGGVAVSQIGLYLITLAASVIFAVAVLATYTRRVSREPAPVSGGSAGAEPVGDEEPGADGHEPTLVLTPPRAATLLGIAVLAVGLLVFRLDVGMLALVVAVLLHLAFPRANAEAFRGVNWSVLVMLCGIVTYVELLERGGTVDAVSDAMASLGSPLIAVLLLCVTVAAFSAFASSAALIATGILLVTPFITSGSVPALGVAAAIAISATAVDVSPVSAASALLVAGAPPESQRELYRGLMRWSLSMVVIAPVLTVALLVLPGL